ncbi:MAG: hypothetical protein N2C14_20340 [Planctomycetales bacterium]
MKNAILGLLLVAGLCVLSAGFYPAAAQSRPSSQPAGRVQPGGLIALPGPTDGKHQRITVIDPAQRCMAVYHVDAETGELTLRSARNIHWDMQLRAFNTSEPHPEDIRAMLSPANPGR